jgi:dimethylglycine dehydrogenase
MDMHFVDMAEAKRLFPLMDPQYFVGALYDPIEGHVDPWGVTNAYAKAATMQGATVVKHNRVVELLHRPDGSWDVVTEQGTVHAEHVVNAGGLWAREVGRMVGLELPILAMEHQYIISEEIPEVAASATEMLHIVDADGEIYMRQEGKGMLMGTYERAGVPWSEHDTPWNFGHELLNNDIDRIAPSLEVGFKHYPPIAEAGIKKIINGPFTFAPDGNPVIGPIRGLKNYWVACGVMAGFSQGGGVGLSLANWMINGDPGASTSGAWTSPASATGRRSPTPTPRCARTTRAASASASPTRSWWRRGPSRRRRSTTSSRPRTRCSATTGAWSTRCGSRPRAQSRSRRSASRARTRIRMSPPR